MIIGRKVEQRGGVGGSHCPLVQSCDIHHFKGCRFEAALGRDNARIDVMGSLEIRVVGRTR
jgi:hypothetical protein